MMMRKWLFLCLTLAFACSVSAFDAAQAPNGQDYKLTKLVSGLRRPTVLTHAGDASGRMFIAEQIGVIQIMQAGQLLPTPFLDIRRLVNSSNLEQGLLGLAFSPHYAENGTFFIHYSDLNGDTMIVRYHVSATDPNQADPTSAQPVLSLRQPYVNHNGGQITFGPDGYLYIGLGDGGAAGDPQENGQNKSVLLGKILRLNVDVSAGYDIPADNPFVGRSDAAPEIWAYGLRNPWRFTFDRLTGDLYIGDVGQDRYEEIDFQAAGSAGGQNYGWNIMEANHRFNGQEPPADWVAPVFEYDHNNGCSVTGGYVYRGAALPSLDGVYLFSDYCFGTIWWLAHTTDGAWKSSVFMDTPYTVTSFGEDEAGELYVLEQSNGAVLKLEAR